MIPRLRNNEPSSLSSLIHKSLISSLRFLANWKCKIQKSYRIIHSSLYRPISNIPSSSSIVQCEAKILEREKKNILLQPLQIRSSLLEVPSSLSLSLFHPTLPPWNGVGSLESRFQRFLFVIFIPRPLDRGLFLNRFKSWYSVTTRGVVTRPGLRSRPPRAREPRLAATSAV